MPAASERPAAVEARAWCRVDLAGGTLDIWPLGLLHPGARTVNLAIDVAVGVRLALGGSGYRVRQAGVVVEEPSAGALAAHPETALVGHIVRHLELPPLEVEIASESPRGAGLGASSALAVALIAAGEAAAGAPERTPREVSALACDLEARLMGLPTGRQDHYPALLGGALEIVHAPGGERVRRLDADLERLGETLVLAYSGESHLSGATNWEIVRRRLEGEAEVVETFDGIAAAAQAVAADLEAGDLEAVGRGMSLEWSFRRRLAPGVSTPRLESLLAAAAEAGAWGGKACGAAGGGCVALLVPPERKERVARRLVEAGARVLAARPAAGPLELQRP